MRKNGTTVHQSWAFANFYKSLEFEWNRGWSGKRCLRKSATGAATVLWQKVAIMPGDQSRF